MDAILLSFKKQNNIFFFENNSYSLNWPQNLDH